MDLENDFNAGTAVFREYLEEMLCVKLCDGTGGGNTENQVLKNYHIATIRDMIRAGKAEILFLGSALGLLRLRHELSFALVIHDEKYADTEFKANEEGMTRRIDSISIQKFDKENTIINNMYAPGIILWNMFKKTETYKNIINVNNE